MKQYALKDKLAALFFLVLAFVIYSWQPELEVLAQIENTDALPKIKESIQLIYIGLFVSWFFRRNF